MTDAADQVLRRHNTLNDMTDTAGLVFLGLTVGCARCHDHKFEPIPQADFFRLQAFFAPAAFRNDLPIASAAERARHERQAREYDERTRPTREAIAALEAPARARLREERLARIADEARAAHRTPPEKRTARQRELVQNTERLLAVSPAQVVAALSKSDQARHSELQKTLKGFDAHRPRPLPAAMGLQDGPGQPPKTFLLDRGELGHPREELAPGFPVILTAGHRVTAAEVMPRQGTTGRRAALAEWVVSRDNPLTARVMVNRLWQHHFGRGIVATPSDLGVRGARPTHPELLDWLAVEFMSPSPQPFPAGGEGESGGWRLKRMHRLILTSAAYRQSTQASPEALARDPDNQLFSRMNRLRLEGEVIRDSLLALGGVLQRRMGGPGVFPPAPAEAVEGAKGWKASPDPADHVRRSVYIFARRNLRFPFLEAFDAPDTNLSCPKRERSTTATQALTLLNAEDVARASRQLAARLERAAEGADERAALAFRLVLGRRPTEDEASLAREFLAESPLHELCRALFNTNEFVYLD
jgi:hypothetical protein